MGPDPGIWPPLDARGDVSCVYLVAPLQGLFGAWMVSPPPLWVSLHAPCRVLGDTEMAWLCIFAPQNFIDFLQQTGSEPNVSLPLGRETFLSFRGGQESHSVGGVGARVHIVGACVDSGWGRVS